MRIISKTMLHIMFQVSEKKLCGSVVGWGTMVQSGRSRIRVPTRSLNFFDLLILPAALDLTQPLIEMSARKCFWKIDCGRHVRLTRQCEILYP
jgi:hypothetical protein